MAKPEAARSIDNGTMTKTQILEQLIADNELEVALDLCEEQGWSWPVFGPVTRLRYLRLGQYRQSFRSKAGMCLFVESWTGDTIRSLAGPGRRTNINGDLYSQISRRLPGESYRVVDGSRGGYTGAVSNYVGTLWVSEAGLDE